jgi:hypothetical protein
MEMGVLQTFCLGWLQVLILPIPASQIENQRHGHPCQAMLFFFLKSKLPLKKASFILLRKMDKGKVSCNNNPIGWKHHLVIVRVKRRKGRDQGYCGKDVGHWAAKVSFHL